MRGWVGGVTGGEGGEGRESVERRSRMLRSEKLTFREASSAGEAAGRFGERGGSVGS